MAPAGKQDKLNIQIKSIKTATTTMLIDDIYRSNIFSNNNQRKLSSFSDVLKRKYLALKWYKESTNYEILCKETLTLINDLVIKCTGRTTATHTQPITESIVNNEEDVRDEDSSFRADSRTVGQRAAVKPPI